MARDRFQRRASLHTHAGKNNRPEPGPLRVKSPGLRIAALRSGSPAQEFFFGGHARRSGATGRVRSLSAAIPKMANNARLSDPAKSPPSHVVFPRLPWLAGP